jgi:hypothetical protein
MLAVALMVEVAAARDEKTNASARAAEIIEQARAAVGGAKLKAVESLAASGKSRVVVQTQDGETQIEGEVELSLMLPDKFKRVDTQTVGGGVAEVRRISGFNGNEDFRDAQTNRRGGGMVVVRTAPENPQAAAAQSRGVRREFARLVLGWLLTTPSTSAVELSYAGEAETKDGKADAVDVKGADEFIVRLFFDKQTRRPLHC